MSAYVATAHDVREVLDQVAELRTERLEELAPKEEHVTRLADVAPESVSWLWPGRIPRGKLTILEGDPKVGKSTLALDLAARISTGSAMPDGHQLDGPGSVVLMTAEDGLADTVRPRLDAAGADVFRVFAWRSMPTQDDDDKPGPPRPPSIPQDLDFLRSLVVKRCAALVIVDVLAAYLGSGVDGHRDQDVRRALMPLAQVAEETGAAVVVIRHLTKSGGSNALYRGMGSIGIAGAARSILLAAVDPEDGTGSRRVLAVSACNVAAPVPALGYHLEADDERGCSRIVWDGPSTHTSASLLAAPASEDERCERDEIARILSGLVEHTGSVPVAEARRAIHAAGYTPSDSTLRRAARLAGLDTSAPTGVGGQRSYRRAPVPSPSPVTNPPDGLTGLERPGLSRPESPVPSRSRDVTGLAPEDDAPPHGDVDDRGDADDLGGLAECGHCEVCGAPPPERVSFGWVACPHQLVEAGR